MPATNPALGALRDVHLPDPVAFWPPAPGWWLLLAGCALAALVVWFLRRRRRRSLARTARALVDSAEREYRSSGDVPGLAVALSGALRRVALVRFGRREVAALHGDGWLGLLASGDAELSRDTILSLERALYASPERGGAGVCHEAEGWISATRAWIRRVS